MTPNSVYIIYNQAWKGLYKIGKSSDFLNRFATHNGSSVPTPFEVEKVILCEGEEYHEIEKQLHKHFAKQRTGKKEFFKTTKDEIQTYCDENLKGYQIINSLKEYKDFIRNYSLTPAEKLAKQKKQKGSQPQDPKKVHKKRLILTDYYKERILAVYSPEPFTPEEIEVYKILGYRYKPNKLAAECGCADLYSTELQRLADIYQGSHGLDGPGAFNDVRFKDLAIVSQYDLDSWKSTLEREEELIQGLEREPCESPTIFDDRKNTQINFFEKGRELFEETLRPHIWGKQEKPKVQTIMQVSKFIVNGQVMAENLTFDAIDFPAILEQLNPNVGKQLKG